jgi:hypothetical protein
MRKREIKIKKVVTDVGRMGILREIVRTQLSADVASEPVIGQRTAEWRNTRE